MEELFSDQEIFIPDGALSLAEEPEPTGDRYAHKTENSFVPTAQQATSTFTDDTKDAGEIGAGQNVTALYEVVPTETSTASRGPALTIDFRYKLPDADRSIPISLTVSDKGNGFASASDRTRFTAAVAAFSLLLLDSEYKGTATYTDVLDWLEGVELDDKYGYRRELVALVGIARELHSK